MGIVVEKFKGLIHATTENRFAFNNFMIDPLLQARVESRNKVIIYKSLEFVLEGNNYLKMPEEYKYFVNFALAKKFDLIFTHSDALIANNGLDSYLKIVSEAFAYPKEGTGLVITPQELNVIYMPLLKEINKYIKKK